MKVRFGYTVEVDDATRRAIARYIDDKDFMYLFNDASSRLATRAEVADFFESLGYENSLGVLSEYRIENE